jgi:uncharacterized coiled-coil protein SlyX
MGSGTHLENRSIAREECSAVQCEILLAEVAALVLVQELEKLRKDLRFCLERMANAEMHNTQHPSTTDKHHSSAPKSRHKADLTHSCSSVNDCAMTASSSGGRFLHQNRARNDDHH